MKAFVGHSFSKKDEEFVEKTLKFLKSAGVEYQTGEKRQSIPINEKVRKRIEDNDIFIGLFTRDKKILVAEGEDELYTTSNWVIQESGFAIGKDKELVLFIEEGIDNFPALQSDLEHIPFNRDRIDEFFTDINDVVGDLEKRLKEKKIKIKEKGIETDIEKETETVKNIEQTEKTEIDEKMDQNISENEIKGHGKDKTEKDENKKIFERFWSARYKDKDYNKVREIYFKEVKPTLPDDTELNGRALMLRFCYELGDPNAFEELSKLYEDNNDNPKIVFQLANVYKFMHEYSKAKDLFLITTHLYDINGKEAMGIIDGYGEAALCLNFSGKYDDAIRLLLEILNKKAFEKFKANILAILAEIAKLNEDLDKFFIYAESSLELNPHNTDLRFDLAYAYSNKDHNKLSLLHYTKLINSKKSSMGFNNLGVQYNYLNLPGKSIESYLESIKLNNSLAMANIAQKYLDAGFIRDAQREIENANELAKEGKKIDGRVGSAQQRLDQIITNENKSEKEILIEAEKEREFRVKYSESFYHNIDVNIDRDKFEGNWATPWGILDLKYNEDENEFEINQKMIKSDESGEWMVINPDSEENEYRLIKIKGNIEKLIGMYQIKVEDITEYNSPNISPYKRIVYEANGYMIINENYALIDVMEKNEDEIKYNEWNKAE